MFPFNTFFASFSPFFLRNKREQLSLGRGMGFYFSVWGIVTLCILLISIVVGWIFITPTRVTQWTSHIPDFSVTLQDGILTETGLPEDPFMPINEEDFIIFVSKTLSEIPADKKRKQGIYILKDHIKIVQMEGVGQKDQLIKYADTPELKNAHFDKTLLSQKIIQELSRIKQGLSMLIAFMVLIISSMVALWYCVWSFFWGLIVWLISRTMRNPFSYEQAVGFVLSVFFPVLILSILLMVLGIVFPFSMTTLFLLMLGYNHLSFYKEQPEQKL